MEKITLFGFNFRHRFSDYCIRIIDFEEKECYAEEVICYVLKE